MNKLNFLEQLRKKLSAIPKRELDERLSFYSEMIDDQVEAGLSEEEAVSKIGSIETISSQILNDISQSKLTDKQSLQKRKLPIWGIVLLILGSPIWASLLVAVVAVGLSIYASLWAVIASLWAANISIFICGLAGIGIAIIQLFVKNALSSLAVLGGAFILAGLAIFLFYGCLYTTKAIVFITKQMLSLFKKCFSAKEEL